MLRPYAFTTQNPPYDAQTKLLGDAIRDEIFTVHQKRYTSDNWYVCNHDLQLFHIIYRCRSFLAHSWLRRYDGLYASSGTSQDYFAEQNFGGFRPYGTRTANACSICAEHVWDNRLHDRIAPDRRPHRL